MTTRKMILDKTGQKVGAAEQQLKLQHALSKKPFEGDHFIDAKIRKLIQKHNIFVIVETGTETAASTEKFVTMVPFVYTMEKDETNYMIARNFLPANSMMFLGDSPRILPIVLEHLNPRCKILFYLDAHTKGMPCPLIEELEIIAKSGFKPVIVIHDCKVPDRKDLGFDSFNGWNIELDNIREQLNDIYLSEDGYEVSYNEEATGAMRGVIYIEPKI